MAQTETSAAPPITPAWTPFRPHAIQQHLWWTQKRFAVVTAGRRSGKTDLALRRLVRYLPIKKAWPDPLYFFGAPTRGQAKYIAWDRLLSLIPPHWLAGQPLLSELTIKTIFGSSVRLFGFDEPQRSEGRPLDGGVVDERSDVWPGTVTLSLLPALTDHSGWLWEIGVPKRYGVGATEYRERFERAVAGELPETAAYNWPSSDIIGADNLETERAVMDPRDFAEQFEGSWQTAGGQVFWAWDDRHNVRPCPYRPTLRLLVGCDFNVDPMSWLICQQVGGDLQIIGEQVIRNANTRKALDRLWSMFSQHRGGWDFFCDASGLGRHTSAPTDADDRIQTDLTEILNDPRFRQAPEGRRMLFPRRGASGKLEGNPSVSARFAACNALILNGAGERHLFCGANCPATISDLHSRAHAQAGHKLPPDMGHLTDALGYIIWRLFPVRYEFEPASPTHIWAPSIV